MDLLLNDSSLSLDTEMAEILGLEAKVFFLDYRERIVRLS